MTMKNNHRDEGYRDERLEENTLIVNIAIEKMIDFYKGSFHDISHFLNVYALAKTIGTQEKLDENAQKILELSAVVHDISCPLCREKYGNANGKKQELESPPLVKAFLEELSAPAETIRRVSWIVAHHHTYTDVNDIAHQILLEADYLVNAGENHFSDKSVYGAENKVFRTNTGKRLLCSMYNRASLPEENQMEKIEDKKG